MRKKVIVKIKQCRSNQHQQLAYQKHLHLTNRQSAQHQHNIVIQNRHRFHRNKV